ncbi:MAG: LacI family DNA-binding transcriptional regulator [Spirochaetales bacterium]|uniref:LacI family DNA-binding transcriptional regulator n=1 Tax=Candidatus Thalassospirochaeta sargassi TaxID=3119039 RepID=A0AAJ1IEG5_9SPIO|nr:LacI family DNA-binding transcriptional regulator [Spirochaetales bacterium]
MATLKDIADAAGVSIGTVDRILHNRGRFSAATAEKVRRLVDEMDYTPNIHARGLKKTGRRSFAAVIPDIEQDAGYWRLVSAGIERASRELASFCEPVVTFSYDQFSTESCLSAIAAAAGSGADGLMIAPVMPPEGIEQLRKMDIPFMFIDTDVPGLEKRLAFIGQDSFQSGILSGRLMKMLTADSTEEKSGPILILEPEAANSHLQSRADGFVHFLSNNKPELEFEYLQVQTDTEKDFHQSLETFFSRKKRLPRGIFALNSSVYFLASYLDPAGQRFRDIPIIGYDLIEGREYYIENETINFILTQQPEEQAYRGIMLLYDTLVLNRTVGRDITVPLNIITKENLHTFTAGNKENNQEFVYE